MKRSELIKQHYNEIVNFAVELTKEHKEYCDGWHDDICMRDNGTMYHTGLINECGSCSMEVYNGNAFEVCTVYSNDTVDIESIKEHLDYLIAHEEDREAWEEECEDFESEQTQIKL